MTREIAIKGLKAFRREFSGYEPNEEMFDIAIKALEQEPRKGHWVQISPAKIYECSECGQNVMTDDIEVYRFCHGCGADMRGIEE